MLPTLIQVLFIAMLPVLELRAAIPYGLAAGADLIPVAVTSVIGNLLPVPFLIIYTRKVLGWLRRRIPKADRLVTKLEERGRNKSKLVHQYGFWGICILVAIPLPGTGAWTGALVAAMLNLRVKLAFPAIALGVLIACMIVLIPSVSLLM